LTIDASLLARAAAAAAGHQHHPAATLYVLATPIGNLADISLRAIHLLSLVDAVACEDTRVTGQLLRHLGLDKPLLAVHQHNEQQAAAQVLQRLAAGQRVAYASDAGTPGVSDPGAVLVAAASAAGHRVLPLPGASAAVTALSVAGDAQAAGFRFVGFLPAKGQERAQALARVLADADSQILFEAPHRIEALAAALAEAAPARRLTLCRELTKQFETVATLEAGALPAWLAADAQRTRGEFVLVLHAPPPVALAEDGLPADALALLQRLLPVLPLKQAAALVAEHCGLPRKRVYQQALALKADVDDGDGDNDDAQAAATDDAPA
jgi:16S rRNA (cytidine1402-2'-O)-methyltransferase